MINKEIPKINWFPGHMKKATDEIVNKLKNVDFVIEVVDARCINTSHNAELIQLLNNKPLLQIALKQDLSTIKTHSSILVGSLQNKSFQKQIIHALEQLLANKLAAMKKKGLLVPKFLGLVVGLPNVGKSSLINFLSRSKVLKTENRPGVTKTQNLRQINDNFYLIDTPGVFFKKITDLTDGYKLVLINAIKHDLVPLYDVLAFGFSFYQAHYQSLLIDLYQQVNFNCFNDFLDFICKRYGFLSANMEFDYNRALAFLWQSWVIDCKIKPINYDLL